MNSKIRKWLLDENIIFLNHGSFGACPKSVLGYQRKIQKLLEKEPVFFMTELLEKYLDDSRKRLAGLINADEEGLVFVTNATTAVNTVLNSLELRRGDEIVITNHEYNACKNAVNYYAKKRNLKVRTAVVPFPVESPEEVLIAIEKAVTDKTRFILIDHITSPTALIFPVEEIIERYRKSGIDIMVDGAHSAGMIPINLKKLDADYYTSNCHKWLFAPKGAAFLYVRKDKRKHLYPLVISHGYNSERLEREPLHRMFDWTGTQDFSPYICVKKAIEFTEKIKGDIKNLMNENHQKVLDGRDIILNRLKVTKPAPDYMLGAMASVILPDEFLKSGQVEKNGKTKLQNILFRRYRIEVPVIWFYKRQLLLRISAQVYNSLSDYEFLADALRKISSN